MNVSIEVSPLGNKIHARIIGRPFCKKMGEELRKTFTFNRNDSFWSAVFGSKRRVESFLKRGKTVCIKVDAGRIGFDSCDMMT